MFKPISTDNLTSVIVEKFRFEAIVCDALKAYQTEYLCQWFFRTNAFINIGVNLVSVNAIKEFLLNSKRLTKIFRISLFLDNLKR